MEKELLTLGTIVYLENGTKKIMIIGRGAVMEEEYFDYMGASYPEGIDPDNAIFFNHENVDEVIFKGYEDDEEKRFMKLYKEWEDGLSVSKKTF